MISSRRAILIFAVIAAVFSSSCDHRSTLKVRYLPGIVTGTEHVLPPLNIVVAPASGSMAAGRFRVGGIYNADGSLERDLSIEDIGPVITSALIRCLSDAGLKASMTAATNPAHAFPEGAALMILPQIESISVNKRFGSEHTVHGQYFTMTGQVRLRFLIFSRKTSGMHTVSTIGTEDEPPAPVGGETFLPLETEPTESLSVALSRAVGALILQPEFRRLVQDQ